MKLGVIKHYLKILLKFLQFSFMNHMAFSFNFFYGYLIDIGWLLFTLVLFKTFYLNIKNIAGWNYHQILVFLGTFWIYQAFVYGIAVIFNLRRLPLKIWRGDLDMYLLKPINSQFLVSSQEIWFPQFLNLIPAAWFIYLGLSGLNIKLKLISLILYIITAFSGILIIYGFWFIITCLAFFIERANNLPFLPQGTIDRIVAYPIDIFSKKTKFILTWFIPLAFVTSFPARILMGSLSKIYALYSLLLAGLILWLSNKFWHFCLKHYSSASS